MKILINRDSKIILKNLSYLTVLKSLNIGIKIVLAGYLIRVLGDVGYGLVTWLDSVIQYFIMVINFGFNIYAAKYIVEHIKDKDKINEIVSSIFLIKALLFFASLLGVFFIGSLNEFSLHQNLLLLLMVSGIGEVLFPVWFFQGVENLKPATIIVFISRFLLLLGTIFFVNSAENIVTYIYLLVISSSIMGVLGIYYVFRYYQIKFVWVTKNILKTYFKDSLPFFFGRFLSLVFNFGTILFIGKFCLLEQVAGFDISLKIVMLAVVPFEMLQQAVFPTISRTRDKKLLKKLILAALFLGSILGIVIFLMSNTLLFWFGGALTMQFTNVLKVLSLLSPFVALTFILGTCSLVAFGFYKEYNFSLIFTSLVYIGFLVILYLWNQITFWNLIYLRVLGDVLMMLIRLYYSFNKKILVIVK